MWDGHAWRARGARAFNGVWGAEPPAGSMSSAPDQGSWGSQRQSLSSVKYFLQTVVQVCRLIPTFQDGHFELNVRKRRASQAPNHDRTQPPPPE